MTATTASRSRTSMPRRTSPGAIVRATVDQLPTCCCGQALETWPARHCPRCGVRVGARTACGSYVGVGSSR
jgi:hypothetical protein